jgi:hypothetical protein
VNGDSMPGSCELPARRSDALPVRLDRAQSCGHSRRPLLFSSLVSWLMQPSPFHQCPPRKRWAAPSTLRLASLTSAAPARLHTLRPGRRGRDIGHTARTRGTYTVHAQYIASRVASFAASACRPVCALVAREPQLHLTTFDGEAAASLQVLDCLPDRASLRPQSCSHTNSFTAGCRDPGTQHHGCTRDSQRAARIDISPTVSAHGKHTCTDLRLLHRAERRGGKQSYHPACARCDWPVAVSDTTETARASPWANCDVRLNAM